MNSGPNPPLPFVDRQYDEGAKQIEHLGFSSVEAAFLCRVARTGGYFLRRQFLAFSGQRTGRSVVEFSRRLVHAKCATAHTISRTLHVYHVCSKRLYLSAGCADVKRLRRRREQADIKARLMALDVVLAHPSTRFLTLAGARESWYQDYLKWVDRSVPPKPGWPDERPRGTSFDDSWLVGLPLCSSVADSAWFFFIDDGTRHEAAFRRCLERYGRVLATVKKWRLRYVCTRSWQAQQGERTFRALAGLSFSDRLAREPSVTNGFLDVIAVPDEAPTLTPFTFSPLVLPHAYPMLSAKSLRMLPLDPTERCAPPLYATFRPPFRPAFRTSNAEGEADE